METIDEVAERAHHDHVEAGRKTKQDAYPDDIEMMVMYRGTGSEKWAMMVHANIGDVQVSAQHMLAASLKIARAQFGPPLIIVLAADTYMRLFDAENPDDLAASERLRHGDLTRAFKRKDPKVVEAITVTTFHRDHSDHLHQWSTVMPYRHGQDGIDWLEPVERDGAIDGGGMGEIIASAFNEGRN